MTIFEGPALPGKTLVNDMARRILSPAGPRSCKYILSATSKKPALNIHYIARHDDVRTLLADQDSLVNLSHYDDIMSAIPGGIAFQVGEDDQQAERWEMLGAAFDIAPPIRRSSINDIKTMTRVAVDQALAQLTKKPHTEFNVIREFGYLVPFIVARHLTGLHAPKKADLSLRLFIGLRNWRDEWGRKRRKSDKLRLKGDVLSSSQMLMWTHFIFGHTFGNVGLRNTGMRIVGGFAAKKHAAHAKKSMEAEEKPPASFPMRLNLIERFAKIKPAFVANGRMSSEDYDRNVRCLLVEVHGSVQILVGTSFANILRVIFDKNMTLADVADILNGPAGKDFLDEALRLKPTTPNLYRMAHEDIPAFGIKKGEALCLMTGAAGMDPHGFESPHHLAIPNADGPSRTHHKYLNFGPNEKQIYDLQSDGTRSVSPQVAHPCFGQHWARAILKEMLLGLARERDGFHHLRAAIEPFTGVTDFFAIPDSLIMTYDRDIGRAAP